MPKITEMFAFVVADKDENDEGVLAVSVGDGMMMPMVGADMARVQSLIPLADDICRHSRKTYKILKFKLVGDYNEND